MRQYGYVLKSSIPYRNLRSLHLSKDWFVVNGEMVLRLVLVSASDESGVLGYIEIRTAQQFRFLHIYCYVKVHC